MNAIESQLAALAASLDKLLPFGTSVDLDIRRYSDETSILISIHGVESYEDATEVFRALGIQRRSKSTWNEPQPRTVMDGQLSKEILVRVFSNGLPPSCRLETFKEKVPKTQTVEVGEFVEIERTRVICGHHESEAA